MRALIAAAAALLVAGPALAGPVTLKANPVDADGQITRLIEIQRAYESTARMIEQTNDLSRRAVERLGRVS